MAFLGSYLEHIRLFSRNARLFLSGTFFFGFGVGTFWVLLNLYLRELGLTDAAIGRVLSFQSLGTVLTAIPISILAARVRLKWILVGAAAVTATASSLLVVLEPIPLLLVFACLTGSAFIVHHVLSAPFFMRNSNQKERLHLFGVNNAVEILASVIGVAGGGWLAQHLGESIGSNLLGYRYTLLGAAAVLFLAVVPYMLIHSPAPPRGATGIKVWKIRKPGLLARLVTPAFMIGCGAGLVIPFLNLYFRDRFALESGAIGRIFAVSQVLTAVGFATGPVLARRFGMIRTVATAEMLSIPFFISLAFSHNLPLAIMAFWFRGALMNMNHPISSNFAMEAVAPEEHAFTNAAMMLAWNLSWMVSTQVGGWLIEHHGFVLPMMITVVLYFTSSCLYLLFFHNYERLHFKQAAEPGKAFPDGPLPG